MLLMDSSVVSDLLASAVTATVLRYKVVWFHTVQLFLDSFKMLVVACVNCRGVTEEKPANVTVILLGNTSGELTELTCG